MEIHGQSMLGNALNALLCTHKMHYLTIKIYHDFYVALFEFNIGFRVWEIPKTAEEAKKFKLNKVASHNNCW